MDQIFQLPSTKPAGIDQISIQLYSKHKLTQDIKAQLAHHFTAKLPKPHGNKLLIIGSKVGITAKLLQPLCSQIHIITQQKYLSILTSLFVNHQTIHYRFNKQGFIGQNLIIPKTISPHCKYTVLQVSKLRDYVTKNIHFDIVLLRSVIVHPDINVLKQLMRLRHDVLISMIVPGQLAHKGLFQLVSGIQKNILHVFYNPVVHQQVQYIRYITSRRQQINIWQIFVWIKKHSDDVRLQIKQVQQILQEQVNKNKVSEQIISSSHGRSFYQTPTSLQQYLDFHFGNIEHFGLKNFPTVCAQHVISAATMKNIKGRALDIGCAVGRSTIQLAQYFDQVVGVQYSKQFVQTANNILHQKYPQLSSKIQFLQGDACKLTQSKFGKFDVVFAGNLIDRLYQPQLFLRSVVNIMNPHSILILTSPYSWLEQFTPVQNWIGAKQINGKDVTTYQKLKQIFTELSLKQLFNPSDIRFAIQENQWVYQYTAAQITFWEKNL